VKVNWFVGDITSCTADALVNAANPSLLGGGGVDHAVHSAAGPELKKACRLIPEVQPGIRCRPGRATSTPGFDLMAPFVIHTVGPIFPAGRDPMHQGEIKYATEAEAEVVLASCVRSCLQEALKVGASSVVFPAISCGHYGCSPRTFAGVARKVLGEKKWGIEEIDFVLYFQEEFELFEEGWGTL